MEYFIGFLFCEITVHTTGCDPAATGFRLYHSSNGARARVAESTIFFYTYYVCYCLSIGFFRHSMPWATSMRILWTFAPNWVSSQLPRSWRDGIFLKFSQNRFHLFNSCIDIYGLMGIKIYYIRYILYLLFF